MLKPRIKSRNIIPHDAAHGLYILLGRIRAGGGPFSNGLFLLLTRDLSRMRPETDFSADQETGGKTKPLEPDKLTGRPEVCR
jgi:hypothetical protein